MNWFYAINSQQSGPVSDSQLDELLRSGKVSPDTLIWREGMTNWQSLRAVRVAAAQPNSIRQTDLTCVECGRVFPPDEVIMVKGSWICARCKPEFLQRLQEGVGPSGAAGGMWRTKKQLVTCSEKPFPDRCVRCNAPANGYRLKRTLYWHPPAYYLLILLNLLIYALVAAFIRNKAIVRIGLCEKHRVRRRWGILVCSVGVAGGIGLIVAGAMEGSGAAILAGIGLLLGGAIYGGFTGARVSPAKITKENVWLKGVNKEFLAELPEWPGA